MKHAWLINILGDLKGYSQKNGLPRLAEELAICEALAAIEASANEVGAKSSKVIHPESFAKKEIN